MVETLTTPPPRTTPANASPRTTPRPTTAPYTIVTVGAPTPPPTPPSAVAASTAAAGGTTNSNLFGDVTAAGPLKLGLGSIYGVSFEIIIGVGVALFVCICFVGCAMYAKKIRDARRGGGGGGRWR